MKEKKQWLIRLFIILFSVSVSVAVLPCGIINTCGLFGEMTNYGWFERCYCRIWDRWFCRNVFVTEKEIKILPK